MQNSDNLRSRRNTGALSALNFFPRTHIVMASALIAALFITARLPADFSSKIGETNLGFTEYGATSNSTELLSVDESLMNTSLDFTDLLNPAPTIDTSLETSKDRNIGVMVKNGDTLGALFEEAGLSHQEMHNLLSSTREAKPLTRLRPGETLNFEVDANGTLISLTRKIDELNSETFTFNGQKIDYNKIQLKPDLRTATKSGVIQSSLYSAGLKAGLSDDMIMGLANIFGSDIDFALDLRRGDSFKVIFEEPHYNGRVMGSGQILAAEFVNQNVKYQAVRYTDSNGETHYYSPTGQTMRKAFLRAPLDFRKITSNFNPRRLHPITGVVRPHRGIDYAAARGTPVWASGDAKVLMSGYTEPNGNYLILQHNGNIQTKYLHLTKRMVQTGSKVKQGQIIGTVGTTGYSTGPHLHYEFLVGGVHRDPRTILDKLPKTVDIPNNERQRFLANTRSVVSQLGAPPTFANNSTQNRNIH